MRTLFASVSGKERGVVVVEPVPDIEEGRAGGAPTHYAYAFRASAESKEPGETRGPYETLEDAVAGAQQRFGTGLAEFQPVPLGADPWEYARSHSRT
ncbi:MAG TPA: hypothetical protein VHK06_07480 [Candidatus Limnocylindria bacterium]|nr:hypothetical protein [Candidatus Limnocylindria bacterium]